MTPVRGRLLSPFDAAQTAKELSFLAWEKRRLEARQAEEFKRDNENEDGEETEENRGPRASPWTGFKRERAGVALSIMISKQRRFRDRTR